MMPVISATMPAVNQTMIQIWLSEMPTESAALWLSATARSARPMRVYWKKKASDRDHAPMAMTAAAMSSMLQVDGRPHEDGKIDGPRGQAELGGDHHLRRLPPKIVSPRPMRR
jgi:hypothetical protein